MIRPTGFLISALLSTALCMLPAIAQSKVVKTAQGNIASSSSRIDGVLAWRGIPYAAPPVGKLRWQAPKAPDAWEGVRSGETFGPRCMQTNPYPDMIWNSSEESEDCLTLSVWAPKGARDLPVLFWIHGGGFLSGSGDEERHDGSELANLGAVVVTINYRLGVLGFLAHPELSSESPTGGSGNYALMDMIAALQWVQESIQGFGGNPENVTIFGESAGSFAVSALMVTPGSRGLFHRAIGQSGAFLDGQTRGVQSLAEAEAEGVLLTSALGADSIQALRAVSARDLIEGSDEWGNGAPINLDPQVLPETPWQVFHEGRQHDVPLLAGWTSAETKWVNEDLDGLEAMQKENFPDQLAEAKRLYPATTDAEARNAAIQLNSDLWMGYATWNWLTTHAQTGTSPVYRYLFDHVQATADGPVPANDPGAAHATDIAFVFQRMEYLGQPVDEGDRRVAELMGQYWVSFARTGDPNGPGLPIWPPVNGKAVQPVMWIANPAELKDEHDRERMELVGSSREASQP